MEWAGTPGPDLDSDAPRAAPPPARRVRRSFLGPLALFALFGWFYTLPPQGGDRPYHLSYVLDARAALDEGQFPLRVSPRAMDGQRYPTFQFYGNFPYTAAAAFTYIPGVDGYEAWKIVTGLTVALAGFYTYRCSLTLTRQTWPSVIAGLVFVAAPYLSTDVRARFAYTEAVSFCLLPAVLYYSLRAFVAPRWGAVVKGGVAWALVALSHNITYLYGSALVCLFFLTFFSFRLPKYARRMVRVGACYAVGLALSFWYVVPQIVSLDYLAITVNQVSPMWSTMWAPLDVLVWPVLKVPDAPGSTAFVGLQVGWVIFAAALLSFILIVSGRRGVRRGLQVRLLLSLALAFFIVWSPVDFWKYVPTLFYNLQMTYRVLMFVVLWGAVLAGVALAAPFRRRAGGMRPTLGLALVLLVGVSAMPHTVWDRPRFRSAWLEALQAKPDFGPGMSMYLPLKERLDAWRVEIPAGVRVLNVGDVRSSARVGKATRYRASLAERTVVQLPVFFYPGLLDVRAGGQRVSQPGHLDGLLALDLPPGEHDVRARFVGVRWANYASGAAWAGVCVLAVVALVRRMRQRDTSALAYERRFIRAPAPAAFPLRAAVLCFALLAIPMKLSAGVERWQKHNLRKAAGNIAVSSAVSRDLEALHAFDNDPTTAWAAAGSNPAWVKVAYDKPRRVSRIRLEARETSLLEAWHTVRVVLYRGGAQVAEQTFSLPDAAKTQLQELRLDAPAEADRVELYFSDPVSVTLDGRTIDVRLCNPGYKEIRID